MLNGDARAVCDMRKKLDSGKVSDLELANLEVYVESILDTKIDAFIESRHYKGMFTWQII